MPPSVEIGAVLDDLSVQASEIRNLEEGLRKWYSGISPRYVDLVSDFAGQEFFLLDGEALLQSVFNDPMLDLGGHAGGTSHSFSEMIYWRQAFKCCIAFTSWNGFYNTFCDVAVSSQSPSLKVNP
jgi:hypothetical protein